MATKNPKGDDDTIALHLTDAQRLYLRRAITDCMAGREGDLQSHPENPRASWWPAEVETYRRIIAGLDSGAISPDAEVCRLVGELADANDQEEEYERVVFEHDALAALCEQIGTKR